MASGILKVNGNKVEDNNGNEVILFGAGIGGWMNMENFITEYSAQESQHRASMLKVLGPKKYGFFFDKWLKYFFTEADANFFAGLGQNCIRIPFNLRHSGTTRITRIGPTMGFPTGPPYKGTPDHKSQLEIILPDAQSIKQDRYNLGEQLSLYEKYRIHWSIWLYKDVGLQGMIHPDPKPRWNKTIQPFLEKNKALMLDAWGWDPGPS
ncbi:hypothetical protein BDV12DRAFT_200203 [Aspergillus spectabilis]